MKKIAVLPSIMCADLVNLEKSIREIEEIGLEAIDNIGNKLSAIRDLYTKAQEGKKINAIFPTDKQLERLEKLGIRIKPMNTIDEFIETLDQYIHWYAEKRRKLSLGGVSPIQYRKSLGLVAA